MLKPFKRYLHSVVKPVTHSRYVRNFLKRYVFPFLFKHQPSARNLESLQEEFKQKLIELRDERKQYSALAIWEESLQVITDHVLNDDVDEFIQWPIIKKTMQVGDWVKPEYDFLRRLPDWSYRWKPALHESEVGKPEPFWHYPKSSGNLVHQAYHVAKFENAVAQKIHDYDIIVEFGGGYGCMARLIHTLGYQGTYIIYDLPHLSLLQDYFLKAVGLPVYNATESANTTGINLVTSLEELQKHDLAKDKRILVIATWSLSEVPITLRDSFLDAVSSATSFLIAYQDVFKEVDNEAYFEEFQRRYTNKSWHKEAIKHIAKQYYLFASD